MKTQVHFKQNVLAFGLKRKDVLPNSFTFYFKRKGVFFGVYPPYFSMVLTTS